MKRDGACEIIWQSNIPSYEANLMLPEDRVAAERTWDCPCHGSRFSIDGELLTGPARKDLEKISLYLPTI